MKSLLAYLQRPLAHLAVLSFFVNMLLLAPALFMMQVFDRVLVSRSLDTLLVLLLGMAVALALSMGLDYLRNRLQGVVGNMVAEYLSPATASEVLSQAARRTHAPGSANLRDVNALRAVFSGQGLLAILDVPWVVIYVAVIWMAHAYLGIAAALACVAMLGLALLNDRLTRSNIEALQANAWKTNRYLEASVENAEVVETLGMRRALVERWRRMNGAVTELQRPTARRSVGMASLTRMFRQAVQVLLQALGAYVVITGEATPGVLVATTVLLGRALAPVEQVVGSWRVLAEGRNAFQRLSRLLSQQGEQAPRMALPTPSGQLVAEAVVYRPPGSDRLVLSGVSLQLAAGESLAIVGPSGAGKSTLVRVLSGLWRPTAGTVRLDHVDLAQWDREELGPWLGYVPQDVELFAGTVAENIARLGDVDSEQAVLAARRAGVHELILTLQDGYDTLIDPSGGLLSPGQRQRIALARALYGDPKLLLLDEPNSNLDGVGEQALSDALKALRGKVTVVVVTHRGNLIQQMDKLLVLEAGKVKDFGRVTEVLARIQPPAPARAPGQVVAIPPRPPSAA
ncbi:MAG: type secretion system ATPase [Ramlibacter sp.]|jgi:PrtD family type I secretion system ABC transporter|uniref:type I secretion system permease/ATPase n=1 Tax=Ramlibacter sp. TaxID=1917967 RepID=UPI00262D6727|nr:type I secretion system permease/ATPase [Ramlibacter sp.]MDB5751721.1 type secretion system ATPase [Ramlibacter sp.]